MIVLGVDPGSRVTGYGFVEKQMNRLTCLHGRGRRPPGRSALLRENPPHLPLHGGASWISHRPDEMAIEDVFFAKNVKSSLKIGHARGAVLIAAVERGIRIFEYSPLEIKKAVVGYGPATKEQVRAMVQRILRLSSTPSLDTSDALATAICHLNWTRWKPPERKTRVE